MCSMLAVVQACRSWNWVNNFKKYSFYATFLAQHFPKSRFIGFDVSEQAIEKANKKKAENGLQNVEFLCFDAKEFKSEWEGKFGLVISFNSYHHHIYPEKVRKTSLCMSNYKSIGHKRSLSSPQTRRTFRAY